MPLDSRIVGQKIAPLTHEVDARWLMAYAASLNDHNAHYLDTEQHKVIGHPVFPVCLEWPVIHNIRSLAGSQSLTPSEAARGVHAAHDLHLLKPITEGDVLHTSATMVGVRHIPPGAAYTMRLDTHDESGDLVAQTYQLGIYRGVAVEGGDQSAIDAPELPSWQDPAVTENSISREIPVNAGLAHTYAECARIWNPIHTDLKVAREAGLPDIILHGTATLALAISHIVDAFAAGKPFRIKRLGGRFSAMVLMPSTITLKAVQVENVVSYTVTNAQGEIAISQGFAVLD